MIKRSNHLRETVGACPDGQLWRTLKSRVPRRAASEEPRAPLTGMLGNACVCVWPIDSLLASYHHLLSQQNTAAPNGSSIERGRKL